MAHQTKSFVSQKAALYVRVSTQYQVDKDSLPMQREELSKYAEYALNIKSYEIFEDAGYSAKNTSRPAYQQMMSRMRTGEFSHLVVWKIDRISRNLLDFANMYAELKDLGIAFVSKNEQFDTSTAIGEAMLKIILVFAELERNMTSERVTATMLSRATDGRWNGGRIPFGYDYDKVSGEFSLSEKEAPLVKQLFERYACGESLLTLARSLNKQGLRTRAGAEWSPNTIWTMLGNPFYYGSMRYNYRNERKGLSEWSFRNAEEWVVLDDHHAPIISKGLFDQCQVLLDRRNLKKRGTKKVYQRKHTHIFAGLLTCGKCGCQMAATIDRPRKDGWRPSIYLCSGRRRNADCDNKYISDITIGPFVLNFVSNIIRAYRSFGKTTSIAVLEKKLLRGEALSCVDHIEESGMKELYAMFSSSKHGNELYELSMPSSKQKQAPEEREQLLSEQRKNERALVRLSNLFMFSDESMSEKDYIVEKKRLTDVLEKIAARLEELDKVVPVVSITDEEFVARSSYYIMTQELLEKREVNYEAVIRQNDPGVTKAFIQSIVQNFCILDGKIDYVTFKNGIELRFSYKPE